jgi:hypothetical protein
MPELFGWGARKPREPLKKEKRKKVYTPDFTAKALGLSLAKKGKKSAKKLLEQTYTGFEIRKSIR